jgi:type II secretory pathway predicted ATPase ExeA
MIRKKSFRIRNPQNDSLKQRISFSHQLRGFTLDDALDYVRFHLDRCEAPPELLTENAIKTLFQFLKILSNRRYAPETILAIRRQASAVFWV